MFFFCIFFVFGLVIFVFCDFGGLGSLAGTGFWMVLGFCLKSTFKSKQ